MKLLVAVASALLSAAPAVVAGPAAREHWSQFDPANVKAACLATFSPWKSVGECQQYTRTLCKEIEGCPFLDGIEERLDALEAGLAAERADRIAADNAEREARIAAINAEAETRAEEDAAIRVRREG